MLREKIANFWYWTKFIVCGIGSFLSDLGIMSIGIVYAVIGIFILGLFFVFLWIVFKEFVLN